MHALVLTISIPLKNMRKCNFCLPSTWYKYARLSIEGRQWRIVLSRIQYEDLHINHCKYLWILWLWIFSWILCTYTNKNLNSCFVKFLCVIYIYIYIYIYITIHTMIRVDFFATELFLSFCFFVWIYVVILKHQVKLLRRPDIKSLIKSIGLGRMINVFVFRTQSYR